MIDHIPMPPCIALLLLQAFTFHVLPTAFPKHNIVIIANSSDANGYPKKVGNGGPTVGTYISHWWFVGKPVFETLIKQEVPQDLMPFMVAQLFESSMDVATP